MSSFSVRAVCLLSTTLLVFGNKPDFGPDFTPTKEPNMNGDCKFADSFAVYDDIRLDDHL
jgi:hypothetical protein